MSAVGSELRARVRSKTTAGDVISDSEVVAALRACGVPILIIHGSDDRAVPLANSKRLLASLGGKSSRASLLELPACGHCPQEELPEMVSEAIAAFAAEHGLLAK